MKKVGMPAKGVHHDEGVHHDGYTGYTSNFVRMQRQGLTEALTTDHYFTQAGFIRLLEAS